MLKDDLDPGDDALDTSGSNLAHLVPLLKELVWHYVIERPALATQQAGKSKIVATVFEAFYDAVFGKPTRTSLLPVRGQDELELLTESDDELPLDYRRTVASAVTVYGNRETLRAVAARLVRWRRRMPDREDGQPYRLSADGPGGSITFELTDPPDVEALTQFLEDHVWSRGSD